MLLPAQQQLLCKAPAVLLVADSSEEMAPARPHLRRPLEKRPLSCFKGRKRADLEILALLRGHLVPEVAIPVERYEGACGWECLGRVLLRLSVPVHMEVNENLYL